MLMAVEPMVVAVGGKPWVVVSIGITVVSSTEEDGVLAAVMVTITVMSLPVCAVEEEEELDVYEAVVDEGGDDLILDEVKSSILDGVELSSWATEAVVSVVGSEDAEVTVVAETERVVRLAH